MDRNEISTYMKQKWNARANKDPFRYVETAYWDGNVEKFFALGEERARIIIDPVIEELRISPRGKVALDIGCGPGRFSRPLASRFTEVIGIDVSDIMIRKAEELHPTGRFPNLIFKIGDGCSLPLPDESVDFVYSYEVFQHMPSQALIAANLQETARVIRAGGHALLHFRTRCGHFNLERIYRDYVPDSMDRFLKRLSGRDYMTADAAFRGAAPLDQDQIRAICASAGLELAQFRDDPTHSPGTRAFAVVHPTVGRKSGFRGCPARKTLR